MARLGKRRILRIGLVGLFVLAVLVPCTWILAHTLQIQYRAVATRGKLDPGYELAEWLNRNISDQDRVGMFDAGVTGYFARAHVVNLDGLVNSPEYLSVLRTGRFAQYVIDNRMEYVITYYSPPYDLDWGPADDSNVCHRLLHVNENPALWGPDRVNNYFQVIGLRYDVSCIEPWKPGFPFQPLPPTKGTLPFELALKRTFP